MQQAITKAAALVEAHEYIRRFEGKTIVVKVGGSIMDDPATLNAIIMDICFLDAVGMRPIIVHGGGKSISEAMRQAGLEPRFVQGRRYTDEATLVIAERILANEVNAAIVREIKRLEHRAMALHSLTSCVVFAKPLQLDVPATATDPAQQGVDIGFVGEVTSVNAELLNALLETECIPVIAPIARDAAGGKLNVNADSVAGHVAAAVRAEKLVLVSDTHGIRTDPDDPDSLASSLTRAQIQELVDRGVVTSGMLPKVEASYTALEGGVTKTHIIDGRIAHSLLLEVYTTQGIGTEITL